MNRGEKKKLIIVGAGASGLMAASLLADTYDVTILEALSRIGGRIHTLEDRSEAGAEFVHGDPPLTTELVQQSGATLEKIEAQRFSVDRCSWTKEENMIEGWDLLLDKMRQLSNDITLDAFLETGFTEPAYEKLRHETRAYASGFDLADPVHASTMALYREWSADTGNLYRIKEGYHRLTGHLAEVCQAKGVRILLQQTVTEVNWAMGQVVLLTASDETYTADKLVVTIAAGVHRQPFSPCHIRFQPVLPGYQEAWRQIGYGSVMKLLLLFRRPFWKPAGEDGFIVSNEAIPTWWIKKNLLTGWTGGPSALQWDLIDDQQIIEQAVHSLSRIFRVSGAAIIDSLIEHHIFRWHTYPSMMGGYSYETPYSGEAKTRLRQPVQHTIYFAGEALYNGVFTGTVEAALQSGAAIARTILEK
ncbi:flavin monoamine oxidase family protein [Sediminibacterium soli]|uniref:flavin monoamine oxidase family protein n=1 Tax=Sediminibacterium soli TaxID=2698829 RepID=UPI00137B8BD1|nr:NAD(P)/FAD-dependent oxidoreductase [Sediminibacterium soli]NCI47043.1 FAD-dependent oxidoreductase [Sediminibacterium soli]